MRKAVCLVAVMLLALSVSFAQQTTTAPSTGKTATPAKPGKAAKTPAQKPTGDKSGPEAGMMTKGVAEMNRLKFMAGKWTTTEKFESNEFMPKGGTGTGKVEIHPGPGKLSMVENYASHSTVGNFTGHAVMFYDQKDQMYKTFWCDSMAGCETHFSTGKWEGDKLVFTGEGEYQGKKFSSRDTFSDIKPDSFTFTEESSIDGGPMKTSMTLQYKRASAEKPATAPDTKQ